MSLLASLFDHWWTWLLGIGGLIAGLSWIPGVGTVLSLASSALQAAAPLINGFIVAIIWVWKTVLFPGLLNILGNWATLFTVIFLLGGTYLFFVGRYEVQHIRDVHRITRCEKVVAPNSSDGEVSLSLPWPFNFKF